MQPADLTDYETSTVELGVLVAYLDEIVHAVDTRARDLIALLLSEPIATHLPRAVREELMAFAAQQPISFRAPTRFLRYRYRILQLAAGEGLALDSQLDLGLGKGSGWRAAADDHMAREDDELDAMR